jgi:hypothetical protein
MHHILTKDRRMTKRYLHTAKPETYSDRQVGHIARQLVVTLAILTGCVVLIAAPASAKQARLFAGSFGSATSTVVDPYPLSEAFGVAVDQESHDAYVAEFINNRVEKFDSTGHFLLMFGKAVNKTAVEESRPEAEQNLCTAGSGDTCQPGTSSSSPGGLKSVFHLAVDNSGLPGQQGDVYVADGNSVITKFDSSGRLISTWGDGGVCPAAPNGQLSGACATGGPFGGELGGIATDSGGNLWVLTQAGGVFEFGAGGGFLTHWQGESGVYLAVDAKDDLYLGGLAEKYSSTGALLGPVLSEHGEGGGVFGFKATTVAVEQPSGEVYVGVQDVDTGGLFINRYDSSCHPFPNQMGEGCQSAETFGAELLPEYGGVGLPVLAVDPADAGDPVYALGDPRRIGRTGEVIVFSRLTVPDVVTTKTLNSTPAAATLTGTVNPSGIELNAGLEGCRFEWGETTAYGNEAPCEKSAVEIGKGGEPVEVRANITGLQAGKTYHYRLVASNDNDVNASIDEPTVGADLAFGPALIESTSAIAVDSNNATVQAQVNPNNVDTRIRVEYGTEPAVYTQSTRVLDLGSGGIGQLASFQLTGLDPGTVYHYRVVAESVLGEGSEAVDGPDRVFVTQQGASLGGLPDDRMWEWVSPAQKRGAEAVIPNEGGGVAQSSSDGDVFTFLVDLPTEAEPAGGLSEVQVLSRRTAAGWVSSDIALPHEAPAGVNIGQGDEYRFFSADLSLGLAQPFGGFVQGISAEASEQTPFLRTDLTGGDVESPCATGCYRPLVTAAEGHENVPTGTVFATPCKSNQCGPQFVGATPDLEHVVLSSENPLLGGAPEHSLYEWSGGQLALASVLPDGSPAPARSAPELGYHETSTRNAISVDGSRVVWSAEEGLAANEEGLFERFMATKTTIKIAPRDAQFQFANSGGSKIIFSEAGDLRECQILETEEQPSCQISDLSPAAAGEIPDVQGTIPGASEDGSYVYFVANGVLQNNGVLVAGARPGNCGLDSHTGECNLYVNHDGVIKLIAVLSGKEDYPDWANEGLSVTKLTDRVSPNGRWFAFMSSRSLTGYDNRDAVSGEPEEEVYLYDAEANNGEGRLVCASCDPTGARPHGILDVGTVVNTLAIDNRRHWAGHWIAADLPDWVPYRSSQTAYQSRYLFDSGRLLFNGVGALVPQDSNGTADVYESEPPGVGGCSEASLSFSASSGGCVALISSGTSKEESAFADASENGDDVFFYTTAQLVRADVDTSMDVYDARVVGGFGESPPPPVCEGDACQSPFAAPTDQTPGSLTYHGPGNQTSVQAGVTAKPRSRSLTRAQRLAAALRKCRAERSARRRAKCISEAKRHYGPSKAARVLVAGKHGGRS